MGSSAGERMSRCHRPPGRGTGWLPVPPVGGSRTEGEAEWPFRFPRRRGRWWHCRRFRSEEHNRRAAVAVEAECRSDSRSRSPVRAFRSCTPKDRPVRGRFRAPQSLPLAPRTPRRARRTPRSPQPPRSSPPSPPLALCSDSSESLPSERIGGGGEADFPRCYRNYSENPPATVPPAVIAVRYVGPLRDGEDRADPSLGVATHPQRLGTSERGASGSYAASVVGILEMGIAVLPPNRWPAPPGAGPSQFVGEPSAESRPIGTRGSRVRGAAWRTEQRPRSPAIRWSN